jgi:hypothetical protein
MSREKIEEIRKDIFNAFGGYAKWEEDWQSLAEAIYTAGYRKQSENVIELPCKVGDTMYVDYKGIAYPVKVNAIRIDTKKNNHRICVSGTFHLYEHYDHDYKATFPFDSIGKSLFYTEAEAKMKGGAE